MQKPNNQVWSTLLEHTEKFIQQQRYDDAKKTLLGQLLPYLQRLSIEERQQFFTLVEKLMRCLFQKHSHQTALELHVNLQKQWQNIEAFIPLPTQIFYYQTSSELFLQQGHWDEARINAFAGLRLTEKQPAEFQALLEKLEQQIDSLESEKLFALLQHWLQQCCDQQIQYVLKNTCVSTEDLHHVLIPCIESLLQQGQKNLAETFRTLLKNPEPGTLQQRLQLLKNSDCTSEEVLAKVEQQLTTLALQWIDLPALEKLFSSIKPVADSFAAHHSKKIHVLYQLVQPFVQRYQQLLQSMVKRASQENLAAFQKASDLFSAFAEELVQHHQYELAKTCYEAIHDIVAKDQQKSAHSLLVAFDCTAILNKITVINGYLLEEKQSLTTTYTIAWRQHRTILRNLRDRFENNFNQLQHEVNSSNQDSTVQQNKLQTFSELQHNFTQEIKQFLAELMKECELLIGQPPCGFTLLSLGSISRHEFCPYSDLDCALLIADEKHREHAYFQILLQLFKFKIDMLGEDNLPGLRIENENWQHLTYQDKPYINTPRGLGAIYDMSKCDAHRYEPYEIHRPDLIYSSKGGEHLLNEYVENIKNNYQKFIEIKNISESDNNAVITDGISIPTHRYFGIRYLQAHRQQFLADVQVEKNQLQSLNQDQKIYKVDIKQRYLAPLIRWCFDIGQYYGIYGINTREVLKRLRNHLPCEFLDAVEKSLNYLQQLRIKQHLHYQCQYDQIEIALSSPQAKCFNTFDNFILKPAYDCVINWNLARHGVFPFDPLRYTLENLLWQQTVERVLTKLMDDAEQQSSQPATISWVQNGKIVTQALQPNVCRQLLQNNGEINLANKSRDGRGTVIPISNDQGDIIAYAKFYPEMPGIQMAVDALTRRMSGCGLKTTLVKLQYLDKTYPILLSQSVLGQSLRNILREHHTLQHLETKLDPYFFTLKIFENLLIYPEDEKDDNIIAEELINDQNERKIRLISIDNDHAFVDLLIQRGTILKEQKVQLKSLLFCFELMKQPLNSRAVGYLLAIDPLKLLEDWLLELQLLDQNYSGYFQTQKQTLFSLEEINGYVANKQFCFLPIAFEPGTIAKLYQRFRRLQAALSKQPLPENHLRLLTLMEPQLAAYYEEVVEQYSTVHERFDHLPTDYITIKESDAQQCYKQSMYDVEEQAKRTITIVDAEKKQDLKTAILEGKIFGPEHSLNYELLLIDKHYRRIALIREELCQGEFRSWQDMKDADYIKEKIIESLHWTKLSLQLQIQILKIMAGTNFRYLNLKNCQTLTDELLQNILVQAPDLLELNLSHCQNVSNKSLRNISAYCKRLEKLKISSIRNITSITTYTKVGQLTYLQLRMLDVNNCSRLTEINIIAPYLTYFTAQQCGQLRSIITRSHTLQHANLQQCDKLTDEALKIWIKDCPSLQILNLEGCNQISFRHLKQYQAQLAIMPLPTFSSEWIETLYKILNQQCLQLDLNKTKLKKIETTALLAALKVNTSLKMIGFPSESLGKNELKIFTDILKSHPALQAIDLTSNALGEEGAKVLCRALKLNRGIRNLSLGYCVIKSAGLLELADGFIANKLLEYLNLAWNDLGKSGAQILAEKILPYTTLKTLIIRANQLGSEGVRMICNALKAKNGLLDLDLSGNGIDDTGAFYIAELLNVNNVLVKLDLQNNKISLQGLEALLNALEKNYSLHVLKLDRNEIGDTELTALNKYLNQRRLILRAESNKEIQVENNVFDQEKEERSMNIQV